MWNSANSSKFFEHLIGDNELTTKINNRNSLGRTIIILTNNDPSSLLVSVDRILNHIEHYFNIN